MMGALIVIVGFVLILLLHEAGHLVAAKILDIKATKYFLGFGPTIWSFQYGETEYGIKAIPAGGYVRIIGMNYLEEVDPIDEHRTYRSRPFRQKTLVVMSGIATHFALALILLWIANVLVGTPDRENPMLEIARVIEFTDAGLPTPAITSGIREGDRIISIDGEDITSWSNLSEKLNNKPDQIIDIVLSRNNSILAVNTRLASSTDLATGTQVGFLGVTPKLRKNRDNPITGIFTSTRDLILLTKLSGLGIWEFVSNFNNFSRAVVTNDDSLDTIRPVSVIGIAQFGTVTQRAGFSLTLRLIAYISIFVAIVNTIPLYPFDGGHFAVAAYEKFTGRKPDIRKLMPIGAMFFVIILIIGVLGMYYDIVRPINLG